MSEPVPTVRVLVEFDSRADPGIIAVLLDLLESVHLPSTWSVPPNTDPELLYRLSFGGHTIVVADLDDRATPSSLEVSDDADPLAWLRDAQLSIGRALEHQSNAELHIETRAMKRSDSLRAVAEALDLVAGLIRAGRLREASRA